MVRNVGVVIVWIASFISAMRDGLRRAHINTKLKCNDALFRPIKSVDKPKDTHVVEQLQSSLRLLDSCHAWPACDNNCKGLIMLIGMENFAILLT